MKAIITRLTASSLILAAVIIMLYVIDLRPLPVNQEQVFAQDKLDIRILLQGDPSQQLSNEPDPLHQLLEERFNINLSLTVIPAGEAFDQALAALLASNNPPDMWISDSPDGAAQYAIDNVLADLTYYVTPATMPNYFRYWINETELKEYQVHNKFARAPIPYDKQSYRAYYIRKDWLDSLNLPIPTTYDQYRETLRAFTFNDPDGNGKADTYGFSTYGNGSNISTEWPEYQKNGLLFPAYFLNDQLIDMQTDLRVESVINDIVELMNEGVVEPDWFLSNRQQHLDKAIKSKVGVVMGESLDFAFTSNPSSLQSKTQKIDPNAKWVPFNPFGTAPLRSAPTPKMPFVFSNNAAGFQPEKLKRIVKMLDWLAGEEGFLLSHIGAEGVHYERSRNQITITHPLDESGIRTGSSIWRLFTPNTPEVLGLHIVDPKQDEHDLQIARDLLSIPMYESLGTTLTPPLQISVEKMRARQNEMQVSMLFSEKSGVNWPIYRDELMTSYSGAEIMKQYQDKILSARRKQARQQQ